MLKEIFFVGTASEATKEAAKHKDLVSVVSLTKNNKLWKIVIKKD